MQKYDSNITFTTKNILPLCTIICFGIMSCHTNPRTVPEPIKSCFVCTDDACTNIVPCSEFTDMSETSNEITLTPTCSDDGITLQMTIDCTLGSSFGITAQTIGIQCKLIEGGTYDIAWVPPIVPLCGNSYVMSNSGAASCETVVPRACSLFTIVCNNC